MLFCGASRRDIAQISAVETDLGVLHVLGVLGVLGVQMSGPPAPASPRIPNRSAETPAHTHRL
jgi:hypothetical protein